MRKKRRRGIFHSSSLISSSLSSSSISLSLFYLSLSLLLINQSFIISSHLVSSFCFFSLLHSLLFLYLLSPPKFHTYTLRYMCTHAHIVHSFRTTPHTTHLHMLCGTHTHHTPPALHMYTHTGTLFCHTLILPCPCTHALPAFFPIPFTYTYLPTCRDLLPFYHHTHTTTTVPLLPFYLCLPTTTVLPTHLRDGRLFFPHNLFYHTYTTVGMGWDDFFLPPACTHTTTLGHGYTQWFWVLPPLYLPHRFLLP